MKSGGTGSCLEPTILSLCIWIIINFDQLSKASKRILCSHAPSLTEFLRKEYLRLKIPRNEKKGVDRQNQAEMQGAWIDGDKGFCCAKPSID